MKRIFISRLAIIAAVMAGMTSTTFAQVNDNQTSRDRALKQLSYEIKYLASDELGGRQPGTPGIVLAEKFIVDAFKKAGLKPPKGQDHYFQEFSVGSTRYLDKEASSFAINGTELKLGEQFSFLQGRRPYDIDAEIVFLGYSINADEDHNYNEFRDADVQGKLVVVIRREPQQNNPDSVFDGKEISDHGYVSAKVAQARRAKAAGIIFVNDSVTAPTDEKDDLAAYDQFGNQTSRIPFVHVKRKVIDDLLKKSPLTVGDGVKLSSVADVEKRIDSTLEPVTQTVKGAKAKLVGAFKLKQTKTNNIIGVLEGEGPNADETIVIGAHYDHLGTGAYGSRAANRRGEVHNGADDNATGTAGIMELARRFGSANKKPARRLVFIAFTAEEMGLLGAQHYVNNPIYPLEKTVAMVNYDMIGWLRDDKLTVFNWNSSPQFAGALDRANEKFNLTLVKPPSGFAGSDHLPFFRKNIPVMFLHTGLTSTYHTPDDDFETIDCDGALKVTEFTEALIAELANLEKAPTFGTPKPIRLGAMLGDDDDIVVVEGVVENSVAAKTGLKKGDIILSFAGQAVTSRRQVNRSVNRDRGKTVTIKIKRDGEEMSLEAVLKK